MLIQTSRPPLPKLHRKRRKHCATIFKECNSAYVGFVAELHARKQRLRERIPTQKATTMRTKKKKKMASKAKRLERGTKGTET